MLRHLLLLLALLVAACADAPTAEPLVPVRTDTAVGSRAPEFSGSDPSGARVSLAGLRGSVVLLDFWASWCGPCLADMPRMRALATRHRDEGFVIVGISLDQSETTWRSFVERERMVEWTHLYDGPGSGSPITLRYGVTFLPQTFLIDRTGTIVASGLRGARLDTAVAAEVAH